MARNPCLIDIWCCRMPYKPRSEGCAPQLLEHKAGGDHGGSNAARPGVVKPHRRQVFGRPSHTQACPSRQDAAKGQLDRATERRLGRAIAGKKASSDRHLHL